LPFVVQSEQTDIRTLDKLYNGMNTSYLDEHMWLAPYASDRANFIYVFLDEPVSISRILLFNYTKSPKRGACDVEILVDDVLVYRGQLRKATNEVETRRSASHSVVDSSNLKCQNNGNAILFTSSISIINEEMRLGRIYNPADEGDMHCLFINNGEVDESQAPNKKNGGRLAARPTTSARSRRRSDAGSCSFNSENVGEL